MTWGYTTKKYKILQSPIYSKLWHQISLDYCSYILGMFLRGNRKTWSGIPERPSKIVKVYVFYKP